MTNKTINDLNDLLEKTYEAERGFRVAAKHVKHRGLERYLLNKADQRNYFSKDLEDELAEYNLEIEGEISLTGLAHQAWMDLKALLSQNNEQAMLEEVIRGERAALAMYGKVILNNELPEDVKNLLWYQRRRIKKDIESFSTLEKVI